MVDVTIPPMIGAAVGFITSDPTPVLHMIGTSAAITTLTVMSFGRSRKTDPAIVASGMSSAVISPPRCSRLSYGVAGHHPHREERQDLRGAARNSLSIHRPLLLKIA